MGGRWRWAELARKSKRLADRNRTGRELGANAALIRGDRLSPMAARLTLIVQQPSTPPLAAAAGHISWAAPPLVQAAALGAKVDAGCTRRLGPHPFQPTSRFRQALRLGRHGRFPQDSCEQNHYAFRTTRAVCSRIVRLVGRSMAPNGRRLAFVAGL